MMRCVSYSRVSTEIQASEGVSLDMQHGRIRAWCDANGGALDPEDVFTDAGISGKRADNRPGLQAALEAVTGRPGAVLVVYSLSRLARSTRDTIMIGERLEKAGADLVSLSEKIDTTSAAGRMVFRLLAVMAEFERDLISERVRGAAAHKRSRGERIGQIPYGQILAADGRKLLDDQGERDALGMIAELRSAGCSLRRIAVALNDRGIPTKSGKPWSHATVQGIVGRTRAA